ncbi:hypothetical protein [Sphingobacterium deserti]|uniref:Uncharacterized protein n=1 Tax=Sphingobacterium deserti TaxID=1229276 RepID=A0A0B8SZH3_9SPHI|nr:hypothetical protein [Sphingobacterium deserti]KGE12936.1 hypothetical protein DI53_3373 [Sphingobacterium deserti]
MKITGSEDIIGGILDALDDSVFGAGIKTSHNIAFEFNDLDSVVEFKRKDKEPVCAEDAFWLGFVAKSFVGQEIKTKRKHPVESGLSAID